MFIQVRNVNEALHKAIRIFTDMDTPANWEETRNGRALSVRGPVITEFSSPWERVLWDAHRDCNPFFHLFESLWMLAGRNDLAYIWQFLKKFEDFSDDGKTLNGAYGYRWRHHFGYDQLRECIDELRRNPRSRRVVLQMWDGRSDLINTTSKDLPCNMAVKFEFRLGYVDMQVYNRSNDVLLGAYGANAVHMSFLQEYVALCVGAAPGRYWQVSGNYHVYETDWRKKIRMGGKLDEDRYRVNSVEFMPLGRLMQSEEDLYSEILAFTNSDVDGYKNNKFLFQICHRLYDAWQWWNGGERARALVIVQNIEHQTNDWVTACRLWMERRVLK